MGALLPRDEGDAQLGPRAAGGAPLLHPDCLVPGSGGRGDYSVTLLESLAM